MNDEDAFIAAMVDEPNNDAPRFIFADFLEERGEPGDLDRAELIRLMIDEPQVTIWPLTGTVNFVSDSPKKQRAFELCRNSWELWTNQLQVRLADSPLQRWIGHSNCHWGYRRGMIASFVGTQQVILDAWDDLFRIGPVEEVRVGNLEYLGTIYALSLFLDRPSFRVLRLDSNVLRIDDVDQLQKVEGWLRKLDQVQLSSNMANQSTTKKLLEWINSTPELTHVQWLGQRR